jgi:integrase/recombinase XerD
MINAVDSYLTLRRATGFALLNTRYLLHSFAKYCTEHKETHVRAKAAISWASQAASLAQRHTRYETVRRFGNYIRLEDSRHEWLPPNHFG